MRALQIARFDLNVICKGDIVKGIIPDSSVAHSLTSSLFQEYNLTATFLF